LTLRQLLLLLIVSLKCLGVLEHLTVKVFNLMKSATIIKLVHFLVYESKKILKFLMEQNADMRGKT